MLKKKIKSIKTNINNFIIICFPNLLRIILLHNAGFTEMSIDGYNTVDSSM